MQKSIPKWVQERMREPSTYAAIGIGAVGVGILADSSLERWVYVCSYTHL